MHLSDSIWICVVAQSWQLAIIGHPELVDMESSTDGGTSETNDEGKCKSKEMRKSVVMDEQTGMDDTLQFDLVEWTAAALWQVLALSTTCCPKWPYAHIIHCGIMCVSRHAQRIFNRYTLNCYRLIYF